MYLVNYANNINEYSEPAISKSFLALLFTICSLPWKESTENEESKAWKYYFSVSKQS